MENKNKIIYLVATGLLTLLLLGGAGMYIFNHGEVSKAFTALGYPTYIIYPLAIAKILALVAIWSRKSAMLKEWAYAGLFYDFVLAVAAHVSVRDGEYAPALVAILLLIVSYVYDKKVYS